jgi:large subunit ribosomal protein L15
MSLLNRLPNIVKSQAKRIGRGYGSGQGGHYSTRGGKGHTAREGGETPLWFEGGQLPLIKRLPMQRGKGRLVSLKTRQEVQLRDILGAGMTDVNPITLAEAGLIRVGKGLPRVIGTGEIKSALTFTGLETSSKVKQAVEAAGGTVTL